LSVPLHQALIVIGYFLLKMVQVRKFNEKLYQNCLLAFRLQVHLFIKGGI